MYMEMGIRRWGKVYNMSEHVPWSHGHIVTDLPTTPKPMSIALFHRRLWKQMAGLWLIAYVMDRSDCAIVSQLVEWASSRAELV